MNAVASGQLGRRRSGVQFFEDPDDLRFGEAAAFYVRLLGLSAPSSQFQPEPFCHLRSRKHGGAKRLSVICDYLRRTGWAMQLMAAQSNARGDAATITVDVAIALVDGALAEGGRHVGCSRSEITDAFSYLTSSLVAAAVWSSSKRDAIVITAAPPA